LAGILGKAFSAFVCACESVTTKNGIQKKQNKKRIFFFLMCRFSHFLTVQKKHSATTLLKLEQGHVFCLFGFNLVLKFREEKN
jgi:hypothetical protein